ncbi:MAG: hypothetical protein OEY33_07325 [Bdellovibrionales bacterium]|jgi:hypothetical protein|nr:hypothetical protein [Bdellovibrionales bacterium]
MVSKDGPYKSQDSQVVSLKSLAKLSGISESLIQDELSINEEEIALDELRLSMMKLLDKTFNNETNISD